MVRLLSSKESGWSAEMLEATAKLVAMANPRRAGYVRNVHYVCGRRIVIWAQTFVRVSAWQCSVDLHKLPSIDPVLVATSNDEWDASAVAVPFSGVNNLGNERPEIAYLAWTDCMLTPMSKAPNQAVSCDRIHQLVDLRGNKYVIP